MDQKSFNSFKESIKEAINMAKGKHVPGSSKNSFKIRRHEKPIKSINIKFTPEMISNLRIDKLNLSQNNFAAVLGVSPSSVKSWEQGKRVPDQSTEKLMFLLNEKPSLTKSLVTNI